MMASMVKVYRDYSSKELFDEDFFPCKRDYSFESEENVYNIKFSTDVTASPPREKMENQYFNTANSNHEGGINILYGDEQKRALTEEEEIQQICAQNGYYNTRKYSKISPDGEFQCHKCSETFSYSIYYQYHIENSRCSGKRYNRVYYHSNKATDIADDHNNNKRESKEEKVHSKPVSQDFEVKDQNDLATCKPFKCSMCTSRFSTAHNLKVHLRTHTNEKPYQCTVCSARFKSSGSLTIHKRIHTGEKPYKCSICSAGFAQMTNLDRHIRTHTKERPYKCPVCPSGFISSSDLKRHIRIHTNEKPYKCNMCTASFRTSGNLKIHLRTHTNEKPYVCSLCSKSFATSSNFKTHMRRHEEENGDTPIISVKV